MHDEHASQCAYDEQQNYRGPSHDHDGWCWGDQENDDQSTCIAAGWHSRRNIRRGIYRCTTQDTQCRWVTTHIIIAIIRLTSIKCIYSFYSSNKPQIHNTETQKKKNVEVQLYLAPNIRICTNNSIQFVPLIPVVAGLDMNTEGRRRRGSRDSKWPIACASAGSFDGTEEAHLIGEYRLEEFDEFDFETINYEELEIEIEEIEPEEVSYDEYEIEEIGPDDDDDDDDEWGNCRLIAACIKQLLLKPLDYVWLDILSVCGMHQQTEWTKDERLNCSRIKVKHVNIIQYDKQKHKELKLTEMIWTARRSSWAR